MTTENNQGQYQVICDDCKTEIKRTNDVRESYMGGRCDDCKRGDK